MRNIYEIKYLKYAATKYRCHNGLSFFVVLRGKVMITIKDKSMMYKEGEMFIVKHSECYKLDVTSGNIVAQIQFHESLLDNMMPSLLSDEYTLKDQEAIKPLRDKLIQLCSVYLTTNTNKNIRVMKKLIYVLEHYDRYIVCHKKKTHRTIRKLNPMIEEIKHYINEHYSEKITLNTFTKK